MLALAYNPLSFMNLARVIRVVSASMGILLAAPALPQDLSEWNELSPKGAGFAIRLPGIAAEQTDQETNARQFEIRSGDRRCFVSDRALTAAERKADPAAALEKLRDAFMARMSNPQIRDSASSPVGASPGLVWTFDTQAPNAPPIRVRGKMVLAEGRVYTLIYADRKYAFEEEAPGVWFETFRLTG